MQPFSVFLETSLTKNTKTDNSEDMYMTNNKVTKGALLPEQVDTEDEAPLSKWILPKKSRLPLGEDTLDKYICWWCGEIIFQLLVMVKLLEAHPLRRLFLIFLCTRF
ncbi:uncharacterized protein LOC132641036 [Lycium barbarum]|uniref:uncharacterized protein LOC132641036 n=1 Tax=Lycium barbarum TaxID=112863 RepID=UPI00293ED198|nr:uncharacterized protein LOC132641036 [Lycium barbarum]